MSDMPAEQERVGQCPVCLEDTALRRVPCGHAVCAACLRRMVRPACPLCREPLGPGQGQAAAAARGAEGEDDAEEAKKAKSAAAPPGPFADRDPPKPRQMTVAEAKGHYRGGALMRGFVHGCALHAWRPGHPAVPHSCARSVAGVPAADAEFESLEELSAIAPEDACRIMPVFRSDVNCPKTGCVNLSNCGTGGGWCANIQPDGTPHCLHRWCHAAPHWSSNFTACAQADFVCTVWPA